MGLSLSGKAHDRASVPLAKRDAATPARRAELPVLLIGARHDVRLDLRMSFHRFWSAC
ncbi:MAG: hypothetical protein U1F11_05630 [Steroidobacteraceae bacterium]